jgi:FHA domain containing protein
MSNIMDCPYGHRFSKTRYGTICPHCGFDLDTPEKVYVNLRKECGLSLKEERPVCAWLVCIEGARRGKSYVISFGENFIGTDRDNEIQILGDEKIKKKHTLIYFDENESKGMLLPARADGIVYIKDKPQYDKYVLEDKNILEIGNSKFLYKEFLSKHEELLNKWKCKEIGTKEDLLLKNRKYRTLKMEKPTFEEKYKDKRFLKRLSLEEEFPICAWLVCIEGVRQGCSYNIIEGKNYIGRNDTMTIQILGDDDIRDNRHAVIAFDMRVLKGTLLGEECMGFVRLNETAVYTSIELKDGDILEIGMGKFMYIDYAGNHYGWEEKGEEAKTSGYDEVE